MNPQKSVPVSTPQQAGNAETIFSQAEREALQAAQSARLNLCNAQGDAIEPGR